METLGGPRVFADRDAALQAAIDQWIAALGHEEHNLRERLRQVSASLRTRLPT